MKSSLRASLIGLWLLIVVLCLTLDFLMAALFYFSVGAEPTGRQKFQKSFTVSRWLARNSFFTADPSAPLSSVSCQIRKVLDRAGPFPSCNAQRSTVALCCSSQGRVSGRARFLLVSCHCRLASE
jgi:hypothetical protein